MKIIKTFKNIEDGVQSEVAIHEKGFSVILKDLDSGKYIETIKIYPSKKKAINYAKQIVSFKITSSEKQFILKQRVVVSTKKWNLKNIGLKNLASIAKQSKDFRSFEKQYILEIKHGLFWHVTEDANFKINPKIGSRDMSSLSDGSFTPGTLMITSWLDYWIDFYGKDRPYVALVDMSDVPITEYYQVKRGFGNEFMVNKKGTKKAKVVKVIPVKNALAIDRRYEKIKPQNKHDLENFYNFIKGLEHV